MGHRSFDDPNSLDARQALLDRRCERAHPKRHRTRKRSAAARARAIASGRAKTAQNAAERARFLADARAYWAGERPDHPTF